jgi:hypothetical protein
MIYRIALWMGCCLMVGGGLYLLAIIQAWFVDRIVKHVNAIWIICDYVIHRKEFKKWLNRSKDEDSKA